MEIKEKEIELLEDSLNKIKAEKKKYDTTSVTMFLTSITIFLTSDLSSSIRLALFDVEVKSIYAVFALYFISLVTVNAYLMKHIREIILFNRYRELLKEQYSDIPASLELMNCTDVILMEKIFVGRWSIINNLFQSSVMIPFIVCYFIMAYKLITIDGKDNITLTISAFILLYSLYFLILMFKSIQLKIISERAYRDNELAAKSDS